MFKQFTNINWIQSALAFVFIIVFCSYFIPAPNHAIRVHDTFDGNFSSRHVLIKSGHLFDVNPNAIVPGIMNGLPRGVLSRFTDLVALMMYFFGSLGGFSFTFLVVRLIGFYGIYLFGKDHLNLKDIGFLLLASVAFATLPIFIVQGITVSGVPILMWAYYNLIKRNKLYLSFFVIIGFGFWSQLVLVGFHIILIMGAILIWDFVKIRRINWLCFFAILVLMFTYILSDYMLFYLHGLNSNYESSRSAFEKELSLNFKGVIGGTFTSLFSGDYSTANYFGYLFLPLFIWYTYVLFKERKNPHNQLGLIFLVITVASAFFINLLDWKGFAFFYEKFSFANVFNFKRFTSILPAFFFLTILIASIKLNNTFTKWGAYFTSFLFIVLFIFIWRGNISYNNSGFNNTGWTIEKEEVTTFNQFFDPALYKEIKEEMGKDSTTNLIHFGVSPSPSKYAGIPVLDDYQGDYPKAYKIEFRKIIEKELNKSSELKKYFDEWGARCYLYSANQIDNKLTTKQNMPYEPNLEIDVIQLKNMNCYYLLSKILIGNAKSLGLSIQKVLVSRERQQIHILYKIL